APRQVAFSSPPGVTVTASPFCATVYSAPGVSPVTRCAVAPGAEYVSDANGVAMSTGNTTAPPLADAPAYGVPPVEVINAVASALALPSAPLITCRKRAFAGPPVASTLRRNLIVSSSPGSPPRFSAGSTATVAAGGT